MKVGEHLRVGILISTPLPPREGIGHYAWNLARYLVNQGHAVQIITRGSARATYKDVVEDITIWRPTFLPLYPFHVHLHGWPVNKLIRQLEPDVDLFHIHSPLSPVISTRRPSMVTFHSMVTKNVKSTPIKSFYTFSMKLQAHISYRLELGSIKRSKFISAVSPSVAEDLQPYLDSPREIQVSWNGVDVELFKPLETYAPKEKLVITVGRLAPGKGLEDLITAASIVVQVEKSVQFLIVGEGNLRSSLLRLVAEKGLDEQVKLAGQISDRDLLADLYRKSALFVHPSHHEGLPTVVLEAMACGCPVLATSVGGIPWVIQDGENGCLIPTANPSLLAEKILWLLSNPGLSVRLGKQSRITVEDRFSWQSIGSWYIDCYKRLSAES